MVRAILMGTIGIAAAASLAACSTAKVFMMPGADGNHRVTARDRERDDASQAAHEAAREYCDKKGKEAVYVSNETKYDGQMEEGARNSIRQGSKVAMALGGYGSPIGTAGRGGYMYTNERDYEARIQFRCQ